jgi:hypothetical protein
MKLHPPLQELLDPEMILGKDARNLNKQYYSQIRIKLLKNKEYIA